MHNKWFHKAVSQESITTTQRGMRKLEVDSQRDVEEGGDVKRSKDEKLERGLLLLESEKQYKC